MWREKKENKRLEKRFFVFLSSILFVAGGISVRNVQVLYILIQWRVHRYCLCDCWSLRCMKVKPIIAKRQNRRMHLQTGTHIQCIWCAPNVLRMLSLVLRMQVYNGFKLPCVIHNKHVHWLCIIQLKEIPCYQAECNGFCVKPDAYHISN